MEYILGDITIWIVVLTILTFTNTILPLQNNRNKDITYKIIIFVTLLFVIITSSRVSFVNNLILIVGYTLFLLEILLPFGGVIGLLGTILIFFYGYKILPIVGGYGTVSSILSSFLLIYLVLRWLLDTNRLSKFIIKSHIKSVSKRDFQDVLKVGDIGTCVSTLNPSGEVEFLNGYVKVEAYITNNYLESGKRVKIKSINKNKVEVEVIEEK